MATRRTLASTPDMFGRSVRPGDAVAIAVSTAYQARAAAQRLVRVEKIYLDDNKGQPYGSSFINFRDPKTQHLYQTAPDDYPASRLVTNWETGLPVDGTAWVPTVVTDPTQLGHGYAGAYEVVYLPEVRIVASTINAQGMPAKTNGRTRNTYETSQMILLDEAILGESAR